MGSIHIAKGIELPLCNEKLYDTITFGECNTRYNLISLSIGQHLSQAKISIGILIVIAIAETIRTLDKPSNPSICLN